MFTLASTSMIRRQLLTNVGLVYEAIGANVDEDAIKDAMRAQGASPRAQADKLAEAKAVRVSQKVGGLVLGCDQILSFEGRSFDKATTLDEAGARLRQLRGQTHHLECAVVVARDGVPIWRLVTSPHLTMRNFSDAFLADYLRDHGNDALSSVGCYQFEGAGAGLFESVKGDYFSILGLPLLEVMAFLRLHGCAPQ
jgi:septum formation protein